jgi:type II secretory pathway component GspD/PulD (secretin)
LTAPKVTVISGESADLRVQTTFGYAGDIEVDTNVGVTAGGGVGGILTANINYEDRTITSGTILNITPIISYDRKYVILNIEAQLDDFLGFRTQTIDVGMYGGGAQDIDFAVEYPQVETSRVRTRVSVPDGGTLLLGGQKLSAETEKEAGVPVLSKMPIIGRAFTNRSKVKDQRVLLILVKPTIILQDEAEAEAIAAMEGDF